MLSPSNWFVVSVVVLMTLSSEMLWIRIIRIRIIYSTVILSVMYYIIVLSRHFLNALEK